MCPQLPSDLEQHAGRVIHIAERDENGCVWFRWVRGEVIRTGEGISDLGERGARERHGERDDGGWRDARRGRGHERSGQHAAILFVSKSELGQPETRVSTSLSFAPRSFRGTSQHNNIDIFCFREGLVPYEDSPKVS